MEEIYCNLTGFIQTKVKEIELARAPEINKNTVQAVRVKFPQLPIPKFSGNLQDWVT